MCGCSRGLPCVGSRCVGIRATLNGFSPIRKTAFHHLCDMLRPFITWQITYHIKSNQIKCHLYSTFHTGSNSMCFAQAVQIQQIKKLATTKNHSIKEVALNTIKLKSNQLINQKWHWKEICSFFFLEGLYCFTLSEFSWPVISEAAYIGPESCLPYRFSSRLRLPVIVEQRVAN